MTGLALYEISSDYKKAVDELVNMDLPIEAVRDTLEGMQGDLAVKARNVIAFAQNLEALAEEIKKAEDSMSHRRKVIQNRAESIREYVKDCMENAGVTKVECPWFAISIKKNPPSVEIYDEGSVPDLYKKIPPPPPAKPDKKMISEVLKGGQEVPGAKLIQSTRLDVK